MHTVAAVSAALLTGIAILIATTLRHLPPIGDTPDTTDTDTTEQVEAAAA